MNSIRFVIAVILMTTAQALPTKNDEVVSMSMINQTQHRPLFAGARLSYSPYEEEFNAFKKKYDAYYESDAIESYRFSIFVSHVKYMETHNMQYAHGRQSYFMDINQFSDKTFDEFQAHNRLGRYSNRNKQRMFGISCHTYVPSSPNSDPPSFDWRKKGAVTAVKNQGQCESCWTFSTTGSIEGNYAIENRRLMSFSEQQILDCCHGTLCDGCNGGAIDQAFHYIKRAGGLETEKDYPYIARDGECRFSTSKVKVKVTGCSNIPSTNEVALKNAVARKGPVSVAIDANHSSLQHYAGGVYYEPSCSSTKLDHAVLTVGYGSQGGQDYWIVKNSWGTGWGLQGYILMTRNKNNNCGIATDASFPSTSKAFD